MQGIGGLKGSLTAFIVVVFEDADIAALQRCNTVRCPMTVTSYCRCTLIEGCNTVGILLAFTDEYGSIRVLY